MTEPTKDVEHVKPAELVERYRGSFTSLLPTHLRQEDGGDTWIGSVLSVLRTNPQVATAALNDNAAFLRALVPAAQRGLTPGTEEYYLVPFSPRRGEPQIVQGIIGYQGLIELIYRAGAVSSVIVEVVKRNDEFSYDPGVDERPHHKVDWFGGDRGELIGAYAYARMRDGATSKVVIIGPEEVQKAKSKSASAASNYSPWNTNPEAMWMKTAARQLAKWVPTSAEYRRQQLRDAQAVLAEDRRNGMIVSGLADIPVSSPAEGETVDPVTGEVLTEGDIVDAELVDTTKPDPGLDAGGQSTGKPGSTKGAPVAAGAPATTPAPAVQIVDATPPAEQAPIDVIPEAVPLITNKQKSLLRGRCADLGIQSDLQLKLTYFDLILQRPEGQQLAAVDDLTSAEADQILAVLQPMATKADLEAWGAGQVALTTEPETD
ncbi:phage RecT family recombinase [Propionicimonas paludicola]|uniref:Phage RecT family recombinase n=1 Tax=Propionicimonas paludicola TaxID=185243 RepID=A0A2A9CRS5_9ACTN|nr:recombinase RecT [Propionicimonas paludicola]PFG16312.1 phage RecT family recombinase [Propionicimonas paludicola]